MRNKNRNGLFDEYQEIKSQPPADTFDHTRLGVNLAQKVHRSSAQGMTMIDDYIDARFVDGYKNA